jgi:succinate dehydrogenase / fumarate reductase cytochrome b subunit
LPLPGEWAMTKIVWATLAKSPMTNKLEAERPLSPHLQIYRPMLTMMMSIAHRITGFGNAVGFALLTWWLVAVSVGPEAYAYVDAFFGSLIGKLLLFLFTWSLIHHMLGGIRHLIWDTGTGLDKTSIEVFAWLTIISSIVLTVLVWIVGYALQGGQ